MARRAPRRRSLSGSGLNSFLRASDGRARSSRWKAVSREPAEEGFRDHLLMALERKGDHTGIRGETIAALKAVSSPENLAKVTTLIQGLGKN